RDVNQRNAVAARRGERKPGAADVDAGELLERIMRRDQRRRVNDRAYPCGGAFPRDRVGDIPDERLGTERLDHGPRVLAHARPRARGAASTCARTRPPAPVTRTEAVTPA